MPTPGQDGLTKSRRRDEVHAHARGPTIAVALRVAWAWLLGEGLAVEVEARSVQEILGVGACPTQVRSRGRVLELDAGQRANAAALRAARAWLLGKGLAAGIEELRFESEDDPVPAPGLPKLLDRLEMDFRDVSALWDRVAILLRDPEQTADLVARITVEVDAAEEGADDTERAARRIAQLAFGVSSGLGPSERVERLNRAAVAVLIPPQGTGRTVGLVDDGLTFFSRHKRELQVELGGVICRMLVDRNVTVRFGDVELRVGSDETLHLVTPKADRAWDSPVTVSDPAHVTAKALKSLGMSHKEIRASAVIE
jgi:hypothetical protein